MGCSLHLPIGLIIESTHSGFSCTFPSLSRTQRETPNLWYLWNTFAIAGSKCGASAFLISFSSGISSDNQSGYIAFAEHLIPSLTK